MLLISLADDISDPLRPTRMPAQLMKAFARQELVRRVINDPCTLSASNDTADALT